jgi:hypothetical protein
MFLFRYLSQFREVVLAAERALPHVLLALPLRRRLVQLVALRGLVSKPENTKTVI